MPTYEYKCRKCSARFDLRRAFGENGGACCPKCEGEAHRVFAPVPIIFKGSGFYITDHRNNSSFDTGEKAEKADTAKKEKKTEKVDTVKKEDK